MVTCPVQIDDVRLPLGCRAWEKPTIRKAPSVATRYPFATCHSSLLLAHTTNPRAMPGGGNGEAKPRASEILQAKTVGVCTRLLPTYFF